MASKKEELKLEIPLDGVYSKLQLARVMLQETSLKKTGKNDYANFTYFQLKDFLPEVNKIFAKLGLFSRFMLCPEVVATETMEVKNENSVNVASKPIIKEMAILEIIDIVKGDNVIYKMEVAPLTIGNNTKQNLYQAAGGRSTYYKRYLYRDALEIEEDDVYDGTLGMPNTNKQIAQQPKYNAPVQQPKYNAPVQQPVYNAPVPPVQQAVQQPVYNEPVQQAVQQPVQENQTSNYSYTEELVNPNIDPEALLSTETKQAIMKLMADKHVAAYEFLNAYCNEKGISSPSLLKNKDGEELLKRLTA